MTKRPYTDSIKRLRDAGLRPTRQRLSLAKLLFEAGGDRHVSAESLHEEALRVHAPVSLATVYNTLHQFTASGLLREIVVDSGKTYFDTNTEDHHHFFDEQSAMLTDIPADDISLAALPATPDGKRVSRIDVVIRIESK